MKVRYPLGKSYNVDDVIWECARAGFSATQALAGLHLYFNMPNPKRIVFSHPAWADDREATEELHDIAVKVLEEDDPKSEDGQNECP